MNRYSQGTLLCKSHCSGDVLIAKTWASAALVAASAVNDARHRGTMGDPRVQFTTLGHIQRGVMKVFGHERSRLPTERLQALNRDFYFGHTEDKEQNHHRSDHPRTKS